MLNPSDAEVIRDAIGAQIAEIHTCMVARVKSYSNETQTADLVPVVRRPIEFADGTVEHEEVCVLPDVPIKWLRCGNFTLTFPLVEGDHVLVLFTAQSIAMWRETGSIVDPGDRRRHSLASAVAIPGMVPADGTLSIDPLALAARLAGVVFGVDGGPSQIQISESEIKLGAMAVAPVLLAPLVITMINALAAWVAAASPLIGTPTNQLVLAPLATTFATAATAASGGAAATITKAQ